ncbi:hypothetical protein RMCBS344292_11237 [Rhizopus microsporus]|nr:hypothetical protein RMCBS344292_11237 [Rhizopus microsporus]
MPSEKVTLLSTGSTDVNEADGLHTVSTEYLHSLDPTGLSSSKLELKVGAPIMLLRNVDPASGLCNGTRLVVVRIGSYMLQARLANNPDGPLELIPQFTLSTQEGELPFIPTTNQFPVRLMVSLNPRDDRHPLLQLGSLSFFSFLGIILVNIWNAHWMTVFQNTPFLWSRIVETSDTVLWQFQFELLTVMNNSFAFFCLFLSLLG